MEIKINSNQNSFKFTKKITKFKSGTSSYTIPRVLAVTNKCTIAVSSNAVIVSPYPNYVGTHQIVLTFEDKTTETLNISFALATETTNTDTTTTTNPPPPPPPTSSVPVITDKYLGNIYNNSGTDYGNQKLQGLRSPSAILEFKNKLYIGVGYPEGKSGIMRVNKDAPYLREEFDIAYHGSFVGEVVDFQQITDNLFAALIFDPAADGDDNGYSSLMRAAVVYYNELGQVIVPTGIRKRCTYQDSTTPYLSLVGLLESTDKTIKPYQLSVKGDNLIVYVLWGNSECSYSLSISNPQGKISITNLFPTYKNPEIYEKNSIVINKTEAVFDGKIIALAQTSPKIDNYTYTWQDFNRDNFKMRGCIGTDRYYLSDCGNSRILMYNKQGIYIGDIHYVPMNYNFSNCLNNNNKLFVGTMELEIDYTTLATKVVNNWNYNLPDSFKDIQNDKKNSIRQVVQLAGGDYALMSIFRNNIEYPTIVYLHKDVGVQKLTEYSENANICMNSKADIYEWKFNLNVGGTASLIKNGFKLWDIVVDKDSALSIENAQIYVTPTEEVVIFNPNKSHTGFHLTWIKDGKILYNAMPSKIGTNAIYPDGDFFDIGNSVEYAGGLRVFGVGSKVFVTYVGEFWGGAGNQTWLHFMYENGKFIKRFGMTYQDASAIWGKVAPKFFAGNAKWGAVNFVNNKYYLHTNCEHSGCIPTIEITIN